MSETVHHLDLHDGMWAGQQVYVVGGGPSLRGFDWSKLRGQPWIGCNAAWRYRPSIAVSADSSFVAKTLHEGEVSAADNLVMINAGPHLPDGSVVRPPWRFLQGTRRYTYSLADGVLLAQHTGASAIHLADLLGARRIVLLGFDMMSSSTLCENFHDEYPEPGYAAAYLAFRVALAVSVAPYVRADVVNATPNTALNCFRRAPREVLS